jgi:2-polyprenyl-6-methoxyphenol hydroxylase-like FAD-dependent oxidoreductase
VKPLGVGINLLPHATKVLHQLGLRDRLEATAILTRELRYHSKDGKTIWVEPRRRFASPLKKILGRPALGQIHTNRCSYNA